MDITLSENQYNLVYNSFSFVIASMGAALLFFLLVRNRVAPQHRMAVTLSTLVVGIALFAVSYVLIGGVTAALVGLPALRLQGVNLAVVTLAFAVTCTSWLFQQSWIRPSQNLSLPTYMTTRVQYICAFLLLGLVLATARVVDASQLGRAIRAVKENPVQASSMGISVVRTKLAAFAITGMMAGGAGFLFVDAIGSGDPSSFPPVNSLALLAAAVIGGLGSLTGALIGGTYIFAVQYFAAQLFPEQAAVISLLTTGVGLLVLLLFLPGGLIRPLLAARDRLARAVTGLDPRDDIAVKVGADVQLSSATSGLAAKTEVSV